MYGPLKLSHRSHSLKLRPHEHTSYLPLAFMLLVVGMALAVLTFSAGAATPYNGPEAGSVSLTGTVPEPPPKVAATINSPKDGQHFTSSPVIISGSCPKDTLVEIYKDDIFAGSTPCETNGTFSLQIDPLFGHNTLTARVYDVLNQAGPLSNSVNIFYDYNLSPAAGTTLFDFSGAQLLLNTDAVYRGSFPNQNVNVPITVIGGTPPFAINIQWGDLSNKVVPASTNTTFNVSHAYNRAGTYRITIQATDSKGLVAFLTVAAIINGQPALVNASVATKESANKLVVLWPVYAVAVSALASFWIGERREKHLLKAAQPVVSPFSGSTPTASPPTS